MIDRSTKLRWRRNFRKRKKKVEDISVHAEEHLEKHLLNRLYRLEGVRRFVIGWVALMVLLVVGLGIQIRALGKDYQKTIPAEGGIYTEGVVGAFTNANPIYATGSVDNSVSKLLFSGLLRYDSNNNLVGDLAESYSVDASERVYTVKLKDGLKWHDGQPVTGEDVVFTYKTIQNPDAKSPLEGSWTGIDVAAKDSKTVVFTLPNVLAAFPYSLTNGILPKHKFTNAPATQMRSQRFNTAAPIGSGPFKWDSIQVTGLKVKDRQETIGLVKNDSYHLGAPKIQKMIIKTYHDEEEVLESFNDKQLNGVSGLDSLPNDMQNDSKLKSYSMPITGQVNLFFKSSEGLLADPKLRQALVQATDTKAVVASLGYPAIVSNSPLLKTHLGYDKAVTQLATNVAEANKLLDQAGWVKNNKGIREKVGKALTIRLISQNTSEYTLVAQKIQEQWAKVGVVAESVLQPSEDFEGTLARHDYDALLYGISLGLDPDVFAYWHSSQADIRSTSRLNFSEYKSTQADKALEAGRTRIDPAIRVVKYKPFLEAWRADAPAISFYQPRYLYITQGQVYNFAPTTINTATDRYADVHNWMIREEKINK